MLEKKVIFHTKDTAYLYILCEEAKSLVKKLKGLMYREYLEENKGMIFSFLIPWPRLFWMKNVKISLDIIFINSKNKIIKIHEAPIDKGLFNKYYWSHGFCKYVIETNMGFCKKNNIKKGTKIEIQII